MTRDEVVALTQRRLGYRTDLQADIVSEMDLAQIELTKMSPFAWFLQSRMATAIEAAFQPMAMPPSFLAFTYDDLSICYTDNRAFRLRSTPYPAMKEELLPRVAVGRPRNYAQRTPFEIQFWPTPDRDYPIEVFSFQREPLPSTLASGGVNRWTEYEPELLALAAALRIAPSLRDSELTAYLTGEVTRLASALKVTTNERNEQGIERIINESLLPENEEEEILG